MKVLFEALLDGPRRNHRKFPSSLSLCNIANVLPKLSDIDKLFVNKIAKRFLYFIMRRMAVRVLNPRNVYVAFANVITWSFSHC